MPRYYFHLRSKDQLTWDQVGVDLPDPTTAKAQQISLLQNSVAASCMKARMGAVGLLRSPMKVMKSSISRHFRRGAYVQERRHYQPCVDAPGDAREIFGFDAARGQGCHVCGL
jgi:hypothetical protein